MRRADENQGIEIYQHSGLRNSERRRSQTHYQRDRRESPNRPRTKVVSEDESSGLLAEVAAKRAVSENPRGEDEGGGETWMKRNV